MAREFTFVDGFDCYTTWQKRWDDAWGGYGDGHFYHTVAEIIATGDRLNAGRMHVSQYTGGMRRSRFDSDATWVVGVACKPSLQGGGMHAITLLYNDCPNIGVRITSSGGIEVFTWTGGGWVYSYYRVYGYTVIGSYYNPVFSANSWNYLEFKVTLHATNGSIEVRANGIVTPIISESGICTIYQGTSWTPTALANGLVLGGYKDFDPACGTCTMDFDDVYVEQGADAAFHGDARAFGLLVDGAGSVTEMTPYPSAPNYECVNESNPNDDTDYVRDGTPTHRDLYTIQNLPSMPDGATIHVAAISVCAKKATPGIAEGAPLIKSIVEDVGDTFTPVAGTYNYYTSFWENDPNTDTAWTVSAIDNLEIGQKVIT